MSIEKIKINGHYVWVDKDADRNPNDWYIGDGFSGKNIFKWHDSQKKYKEKGKIIAASPELNLEGVPTYVEWLALEKYPKDYQPIGRNLAGGRYDVDVNFSERYGFIKGYQTAEKELPTWDDVRKAIDLATTRKHDDTCIFFSAEEIIEQLKK